MKTSILRTSAALLGVAVMFTTMAVRADEPKKTDDGTVKPAKPDKMHQIATRDGRHSTSAKSSGSGGADGTETRVPTGSQIPQTYQRKAHTTDRSDSSYIYDKDDIRLQSTNNVSDSLRSVPGVTVSGKR